jgi:V-type H+-transporting ATPase subunit G
MYMTPPPGRETTVWPCADRTKRVKDARSEAQKEIEDYRKEKEEEFKKFESEVRHTRLASALWWAPRLTAAQHSSGNKKAEDDAKADTDKKVQEIDGIGKKSGPKVVEQLLEAVTSAKPEPPRGRNWWRSVWDWGSTYASSWRGHRSLTWLLLVLSTSI